ncbi:MAG TPA: hypothetical protein DCL47_01050 [Pantoea agglomerans]|nr:hypothetical protein A3L21_11375 [Pantoea agglomerans]HAH12105.1 hypothetical protein [Pantoea agglomerans]HBP95286.1 hypothetical protein [Pantoea agglomerans]
MSEYYQIILRVIFCEQGCKRGVGRLQRQNITNEAGFKVIFKARQNRSQRDLLSTQKKATPLSQRGPYHSA